MSAVGVGGMIWAFCRVSALWVLPGNTDSNAWYLSVDVAIELA